MDEICQICGMRKATIVVKTNVNGVKSEQHLCPYCAAKLSEGENFVQDFFNEAAMLMSGMGGYRTTSKVCNRCGTTEREVRKNLRFGCSECYHVFADIVEQTYRQMRGKPYTGRAPRDTLIEHKPKEKIKPIDEAEAISRQIDEAVKARDFNLAAKLQAKLDALKK